MARGGDLKLLGTAVSPFAIRVRMALAMKGLSYENIEEDLSNKSELLLTSNPVHKKVPVLINDGKPICDSQIIVQYVDEVWSSTGSPILTGDPYDRAIARFWASYVDDKLFPPLIGMVRAATEEERAEKTKEILAVTGTLEEAFAQCSKGKAFFAGDSVGYLDLAVGCYLFWLEALPEIFGVAPLIDASKTPLLAAWAERFGETEEAKVAVPGVDKAVEYVIRARRAAAEAE